MGNKLASRPFSRISRCLYALSFLSTYLMAASKTSSRVSSKKTRWEVERERDGESASIASLLPNSPVGIEFVQDAE